MTPRKNREIPDNSSGSGKEQKEDETKRRSEDDSDEQEEEEEKMEHGHHDAAQRKRRLAMNRESARQRRKRNRVLMDDLHQDNGRLRLENAELRRAIEQLRKRVQELENVISSSLPFLKTSAAVSSIPSQANGTCTPSSTALNAVVNRLPPLGLPTTTTRGSLRGTVMSSQSQQLAHHHELQQLQQLQQLATLQALQPLFAAGGIAPPPALIHPQVSRAMGMNATGINNNIGSSVGATTSVNDEQQNQQRRPTGTSAVTDEDHGSLPTAPAASSVRDPSSNI